MSQGLKPADPSAIHMAAECSTLRPQNWRRRAAGLRRPVIFLFSFFMLLLVTYTVTPIRPDASFELGSEQICHFGFSPDSSMISIACSEDRETQTIHILEVESCAVRCAVKAAWPGWRHQLFSPDSRFFAAYTEAGDAQIWASQTGAEIGMVPLQNKNERTSSVDFMFSPDSRFLVFGDKTKLWDGNYYTTFWNIERGCNQGTIKADYGTLAFAPDGQTAATRKWLEGKTEVVVWGISLHHTPMPIMEISIPPQFAQVRFAPDLATFVANSHRGKERGEVAVWDMKTGTKRYSIQGDEGKSWFPLKYDGRFVVIDFVDADAPPRGNFTIGPPGPAKVLDFAGVPKGLGVFTAPPLVSPDGQWFAVPLSSGVELVQTSNLETRHVLQRKDDQKWRLSNSQCEFSGDGKKIAVQLSDVAQEAPFFSQWLPTRFRPAIGPPASGVRLWEVETGRELMVFENCDEVHFSPDGKYVATLHNRSTIHFWRLPLQKPLWAIIGLSAAIWVTCFLLGWLINKVRRRRVAFRN